MKRTVKKVAQKFTSDQERGARRAMFEELFYDLNRSRFQVYKMNFVRGIFFGLGSVIGGTVVIATLIWFMAVLAQHVPVLRDFFEAIGHLLESAKK